MSLGYQFREELRGVASGTKINSRRGEDISRSTIFGLTRQGHLDNGAVSASVLREIRDLQEMIVRHSDYECRIVAGDDLALGRIGENNCCGSENERSDKKSRGERLHDSQINRELYFGYRNGRGSAMTHRFSTEISDKMRSRARPGANGELTDKAGGAVIDEQLVTLTQIRIAFDAGGRQNARSPRCARG